MITSEHCPGAERGRVSAHLRAGAPPRSVVMTTSIFFGDFEVAPGAYRLRRGGEIVHLEPRVFEVLTYLLEHRDRVVPKQELLDKLWPDDFVTDSALSRAIRDLRRALGDTGSEKRWIQTVYGRGFSFRGDATAAAAVDSAPAPPPNLLERDAELAELRELLTEAQRVAGRLALVTGEAGIGKTTLIETFVAGGAPSDRVLWGSCDALFTPCALGPVQDFAVRLGGELAGLIASAAPRQAILSASLAALEAVPKPALLVLEDLHWADEATLDWLKFVGRRLPRLPGLLVLASYRDDEVGTGHPLRAVLGDLPLQVTKRLFLRPLSEAAVQALARTVSRSPDGLWQATGGNPFFVTEALSAPSGQVPATVRDAVLSRAAHLTAPARRMLEIASTVPSRIEPWLLDAVAGEDRSAVAECIDRGVLRSGDSGLSFRHELARRAIEESLHDHRRRELHARVLAELRQREGASGRSGQSGRLAYHAEQAGDVAALLELGPVAAREAAGLGAHREAAAHYAAVLRHGDRLDVAERAELWRARAYECFLAEQFAESRPAQEKALSLWREIGDRERIGECLRRLSRLDYFDARNDESWAKAREAVATLEPLESSPELALAYAHLAQHHFESWDFEEAVRWGDKALEVADRCGETEGRVYGLSAAGAARLRLGQEEGRAQVEESMRLADAHGLEEQYAQACGNLVKIYLYNRRYEEAEPFLRRALEFAHERDSEACVHFYLALRGRHGLERGDWSAAAEDAAEAIAHPRAHNVARMLALAILAKTRMRRGDPGWRRALQEAWELASGTGEPQRVAPVAAAWCEAAWLHGEDEPARSIAVETCGLTLLHRDPWALGEIAYWGWKAGVLPARSESAAEPFAHHLEGRWREAAAAWERLGCPYEAAVALTEGDAAARSEGLRRLERMGAEPVVAAVERDAADPAHPPAVGTKESSSGARA